MDVAMYASVQGCSRGVPRTAHVGVRDPSSLITCQRDEACEVEDGDSSIECGAEGMGIPNVSLDDFKIEFFESSAAGSDDRPYRTSLS